MNLNLLRMVASTVTTILCPLIVWGFQKTLHLIKQFNLLDAQFIYVRKDVDMLKENSRIADQKLILLEEAISEVAALRESTTEQFDEIKADLKQLPRILTLLEQYAQAISVIVPRAELESRMRSTEDRLKLMEQDIRHNNIK